MFENIEQRKLKGLKIITIGGCCAVIGVLLFVLDFGFIGRLAIYCGIGIAFLGLIVHSVIFFEHMAEKKEQR